MAVTKIWDVKGAATNVIDYVNNPEKTGAALSVEDIKSIEDVIGYADDVTKTEKHFYTTGINCDRKIAASEFNSVKQRYGKGGGIVAYHAYQSFSEGESTPEEAHKIGVQLAKELWGDRFQVVVSTHLNTKCLHNHFVINSVSFKDGMRFHDTLEMYNLLRETSDRICKEHELSVIDSPGGRRVPYNLYKMEQAGMPTRYNVARQAIDEAISVSVNMREFEGELKNMGYSFRFLPNRKYWTITPPGWSKPIRINKLGPEYTKERIIERVNSNDISVRTERLMRDARPRYQYNIPRRVHKIMGRSGLERLYLRYCYELGYLPKYKQNNKRLHRVLKEDLLKCDLYSEEAKLLSRYGIATEEDLISFMDKKTGESKAVSEERDELRKLIKRNIPPEEKEVAKGRITSLTGKLKEIRKELRLSEDIKARSKDVEEKMTVIAIDRKTKEVKRV